VFPLRLKTAAALVLLGLLTLLAGIGQKTFWAPAETVTATASAGEAAPLTVIDQKLRTL
jgi:ABC-type phosphate transport system auxiliary subunit